MTASEKLATKVEALDQIEISESDKLWLDLQPEIVSLRAALPALIAVVADAEFVDGYHAAHKSNDQAAWLSNLRDSLAALDEALGEKTWGPDHPAYDEMGQ